MRDHEAGGTMRSLLPDQPGHLVPQIRHVHPPHRLAEEPEPSVAIVPLIDFANCAEARGTKRSPRRLGSEVLIGERTSLTFLKGLLSGEGQKKGMICWWSVVWSVC